jgi:nicotinamidase-related amidase
MKPATTRKTAIVLIDVQNGFLDPKHWGTSRSTPECETNIAQLLSATRHYNDKLESSLGKDKNAVLICHVYHHSIYPDSALHPDKLIEVDGQSVKSVDPQRFAAPESGESVWVKNVNSAFIGTGLEAFLRENKVRQLVICGLTTDHCVSTTTRMANNLRVVDIVSDEGQVVEAGEVVLVGDACATYAKGEFDAETIHKVHLASLNEEFAQVEKTAEVISSVFDA